MKIQKIVHIIMGYFKRNLWNIILGMVIVAACMPFVLAARYALFATDDFFFLDTMTHMTGDNWFEKSCNGVKFYYNQWQGTHISTFLILFLNPLRIDSYFWLRFILIFLIVSAVLGLYFACAEIVKYCSVNDKYVFSIMLLILLPTISYREFSDLCFWYTGAMAYLMPIACMLVGIGFLFLAERKKRPCVFIVSSFFFVMMAGGVLQVVGLGAFLLLGINALEFAQKRKINVGFMINFIVTVVVAFTNALAPGNMARYYYGGASEPLNILRIIYNTLRVTILEGEYLLKETSFLCFVLLAFILGTHVKRKVRMEVMAVILIFMGLTPFVTIFPVTMGYQAVELQDLWGRNLMILDASIVVSSISFSMLLGNWFSIKNEKDFKSTVNKLWIIAIVFLICHKPGLYEYKPVVIAENLLNHEIQNYAAQWEYILGELERCPEKDAIFIGEQSLEPNIYGVTFSTVVFSEPDNPINNTIARWMGKESVCYIVE